MSDFHLGMNFAYSHLSHYCFSTYSKRRPIAIPGCPCQYPCQWSAIGAAGSKQPRASRFEHCSSSCETAGLKGGGKTWLRGERRRLWKEADYS
jgi:hypothetical protein